MTIEKLRSEMIKAMKDRDALRKETVSGLLEAAKNYGINNGCRDTMTEAQIDAVILKEQKTMQEMIDTCPKDREETLKTYKAKMAIINEFAPKLMEDEEEIRNYISSLPIELTKANMGLVMKELKGKANMKTATKVFQSMVQD